MSRQNAEKSQSSVVYFTPAPSTNSGYDLLTEDDISEPYEELTYEIKYLLHTLHREIHDLKTQIRTKADRHGTHLAKLSMEISTVQYELEQSRKQSRELAQHIESLTQLLSHTPIGQHTGQHTGQHIGQQTE